MSDRNLGGSRQGDMIERRRTPALQSGLFRPALVAAGVGLLLSLVACGSLVLWQFGTENQNALLWAGMIGVQTLPYWAALFVAMVNVWPRKPRVGEPLPASVVTAAVPIPPSQRCNTPEP